MEFKLYTAQPNGDNVDKRSVWICVRVSKCRLSVQTKARRIVDLDRDTVKAGTHYPYIRAVCYTGALFCARTYGPVRAQKVSFEHPYIRAVYTGRAGDQIPG